MLRTSLTVLLISAAPLLAQQSRFISLGPGTSATGISADGTIVVGSRQVAGQSNVFRWTEAGGFENLALGHNARVSADGNVVAASTIAGHDGQFFRWTAQTGAVIVGSGGVNAISADGSTIVGRAPGLLRGFRWTAASGTEILPFPDGTPGGEHNAWAVSGDGSVVAGTLMTPGRVQPFRWSAATGMVGLGHAPGGLWDSSATTMTPDGSVIFGATRTSAGYDTFRWTEASGMVALGVVGGGLLFPSPSAVTPDGEIVVGTTLGSAFVWRLGAGPEGLQDVLENRFGLDLSGFQLTQVRGISADGRTIVGVGTDLNLNANVGWVAVLNGPIPAPGTLVVIAGRRTCAGASAPDWVQVGG